MTQPEAPGQDLTDPTSAAEWIAVANERAADADALVPTRQASVGPVYLAGYAVECSLKAYLQRNGIGIPRGREGHHLRDLWRASRFRLADLSDTTGDKSFFIEHWSTGFRYQIALETELTPIELVQGARRLSGWIQKQVRRTRSRR